MDEVPGTARVEQGHHVLAAAEGADGQAAADDLPHRRQVGPDAVTALGAPVADAERDHLVEDEQRAEALGQLAQEDEEALVGGDHAGRAHHRLDDDGGQLVPVRREHPLGRVGVVERGDDDRIATASGMPAPCVVVPVPAAPAAPASTTA